MNGQYLVGTQPIRG